MMNEDFIEKRNEMTRCALENGSVERFTKLYLSSDELRKAEPWLYEASAGGNLEIVTFLLSQGHSPNEQNSTRRKTPAICAACRNGHREAVRELLKANASLEAFIVNDNALFSAVYGQSLECVKLLVEAGMDLHKTYDLESGRRKNALLFADEMGAKEIAEYLRAHGATLPEAPPGSLTKQPTEAQLRCAMSEFLNVSELTEYSKLNFTVGTSSVQFLLSAPTPDYPFQVLFTIGLSTTESPKARRHVELLMQVPLTWDLNHRFFQTPEYQWPLTWFRNLAEGVIQNQIALEEEQVIIATDDPPQALGPGTNQTCLLLLADFYEFSPVKTAKGEVHFYHVVPIYMSERDFEIKYGISPLLEAMSKLPASLTIAPDRKPFVE